MISEALAIYSSSFSDYKFHEEHPFNPLRILLWFELLEAMGAVNEQDLVLPKPATDEELLLVHTPDYLEAVKNLSLGIEIENALKYNLGTEDNPLFPRMHQATAHLVGGTLEAAKLLMKGRAKHALNMAGGLHHAMADKASGFCIYNDIAVAISWLKKNYNLKIMYIDVDAHHGDGVQWIFYGDPDVMKVSIHETGRYLFPGTGNVRERGEGEGFGYTINMPLEPFTEDDSYIEVLETLLPSLAKSFQPDLIVSQHGCDTHEHDPLTHLSITTKGFAAAANLIHDLAHQYCDGLWLAVGGGGYEYWSVVPRSWAILWGVMSCRQLPEYLPKSWLDKWGKMAPGPLPMKLWDNPKDYPAKPRREEIEEKNRRTVIQALNRPVWNYLF